MAWDTPFTAVSGDTLTAAVFNAEVRGNLLETEGAKTVGNLPGGDVFMTSGTVNQIALRHIFRGNISSSKTTTSTTYGGLSGEQGGPAVTLLTGTSAIVWWTSVISNDSSFTGGSISYVAPSVSGATTVAASDGVSIHMSGLGDANLVRYSGVHRYTGLTAGRNTFTMEYRVTGNTGSFAARQLFVWAL